MCILVLQLVPTVTTLPALELLAQSKKNPQKLSFSTLSWVVIKYISIHLGQALVYHWYAAWMQHQYQPLTGLPKCRQWVHFSFWKPSTQWRGRQQLINVSCKPQECSEVSETQRLSWDRPQLGGQVKVNPKPHGHWGDHYMGQRRDHTVEEDCGRVLSTWG